jgi:hypothetical protein
MTAPGRCTACHGLLVEDPRRPERERIFCYDCGRPYCGLCEQNHTGANDPDRHGDSGRPAAALPRP